MNEADDYIESTEGDGLPDPILRKELDQIDERRKRYGLKTTLDSPKLTGLALSGGGIRSATFALGVMQALARADLLHRFDYLSTVSGGGYIGSSLTWLLSNKGIDTAASFAFDPGLKKEDLPYGAAGYTDTHRDIDSQIRLLRYVRQHGNYITPGSGITLLSGIGVALRGFLLNLLVWFPLLVFAMEAAIYFGSAASAVLLAFVGVAIIIAASAIYSLFTWEPRSFMPPRARYVFRRLFERLVPLPVVAVALLLAVATIPHVPGWIAAAGGPAAALVGLGTGVWKFLRPGKDGTAGVSYNVVAPIGAVLVLYGVALAAYATATRVEWSFTGFAAVAAVTFAIGWFVNLNYITLHRFYRDRLMETFLPDVADALGNKTGPARGADDFRLSCAASDRGPYHLINTNVIFVDSKDRKYRLRGGDSFVLAPSHCGGRATGWRSTHSFMGDTMTLPTAMAISGAAANPNTGTGGVTLMRSPSVALLMSLLNLRLGYWIPNPSRQKTGWMWLPLNHFVAAWYELWGKGYREQARYLQLSDGGHFENLGLYELIRRGVRFVVLCDGGADPGYLFTDFQIALRRIREDFGVRIDFDANNCLEKVIPKQRAHGFPPNDPKVAEQGYIVGTIEYKNSTVNPGGPEGKLIYLKTTMIEDLGLRVKGYKGANPAFPDQSTSDQFFDEDQFEAYRELGYDLAAQMLFRLNSQLVGWM